MEKVSIDTWLQRMLAVSGNKPIRAAVYDRMRTLLQQGLYIPKCRLSVIDEVALQLGEAKQIVTINWLGVTTLCANIITICNQKD